METFFSNILVPVDFSVNTEIAVEKATWLSVPGFSIIHLLHIQKPGSKTTGYHANKLLSSFVEADLHGSTDAEKKLQLLKERVEGSLFNITVVTHLLYEENIHKGIACLAKQLHPSLIIIGESKRHKWFVLFKKINSSLLAKETNCPVFTVKPGSIPGRMRSIVMPVRTFIPKRKIEVLSALTRHYKPVLHLVTMYHDEQFNRQAGVFLETYRTLSDYMHYPVEYKTLKGNNIAKAIFNYAQFVMADFIIVNPGAETKVNTIYGTDICDIVMPESKLNVIKVEPFPD